MSDSDGHLGSIRDYRAELLHRAGQGELAHQLVNRQSNELGVEKSEEGAHVIFRVDDGRGGEKPLRVSDHLRGNTVVDLLDLLPRCNQLCDVVDTQTLSLVKDYAVKVNRRDGCDLLRQRLVADDVDAGHLGKGRGDEFPAGLLHGQHVDAAANRSVFPLVHDGDREHEQSLLDSRLLDKP